MKKILIWDDEKNTFELENPKVCMRDSDEYAISYYDEKIHWSSDEFDKSFFPPMRIQVLAFILKKKLNVIREALKDIDLIEKKMKGLEEELNKKETESNNGMPF